MHYKINKEYLLGLEITLIIAAFSTFLGNYITIIVASIMAMFPHCCCINNGTIFYRAAIRIKFYFAPTNTFNIHNLLLSISIIPYHNQIITLAYGHP